MKLQAAIKRNLRDEAGSFSVEAILMFPLLAWAFMAMYVFFEGLRESNINLKAAYTISDLLSREEDEFITDEYMAGMHNIYTWLSRSTQPVQLRVTVVEFEQTEGEEPGIGVHNKIWSEGVGVDGLLQSEIATLVTPHVPILADSATAIVVESWATYDPIMDVGLADTDLYNIVVTAPRFADQLLYEGIGDGTGDTHDDGTGGENENVNENS